MRLYLDEMISPTVAVALRDAGHDVIAAVDRGALGASDAAQFARAIHERRGVVTYNIADFVTLARAAGTAGRDHWGLVAVDDRHLPPSDIGGLIDAVTRLLQRYPAEDALKNRIVFLRRSG